MKKLLLGIGAMLSVLTCGVYGAAGASSSSNSSILPFSLSTKNKLDVSVSGIWAIKSGQFKGGGVSARFGYHLGTPTQAIEVEGLWLGETAKVNQNYTTTVSNNGPNAVFINGASIPSNSAYTANISSYNKYTLNRWGLFANYRFSHIFGKSAWSGYGGAGVGIVYSHVSSSGTATVNSINLPNVGTYTSTTVNPQTNLSTKHYWEPAAQLFAGVNYMATQQLRLTAGGRVMFITGKTMSLNSGTLYTPISVKVSPIQAVLEVGAGYCF